MRLLLITALLSLGCKKNFANVSGTVNGEGLDAQSFFWGGPFLVITDSEIDCMDMAWVNEEYEDTASDNGVASEDKFTALQFTYESKEVQKGKVSISMQASAARAWFLLIEDEVADATQATGGFIEVDFDKKDRAKGKFDLDFGDEGSLKGDFRIEECSNLKKRKYD